MPSLVFAYSLWAAIGIIPIALTAAFKHNKNLRGVLSFHNLLISLYMLITYGSFYLISMGGTGSRMSLSHWTITNIKYFGIYFIVMGKAVFKYDFGYIVLFMLLLFPLYEFISGDFIMRASIPALFILMTFLIRYLTDCIKNSRKKFLRLS